MKRFHCSLYAFAIFTALSVMLSQPACSRDFKGLNALRELRATQKENKALTVSEEELGAHSQNVTQDSFKGRDMILYVPSHLPQKAQRSMVIALHGGLGNAQFMKDHLKMDGVAERYGFIVAYLNGSDASARLPGKMKAWNAGSGCCGKPYKDKVDDIGYITGAVHYLVQKYGVNLDRVYCIGHSNGAMMTQTLVCETSLFNKAISLAGALMAEVDICPRARGKTILAIHGMEDANLPPTGGRGTKGVTNVNYRSQAVSQSMFESSGGKYIIQLLPGTDHILEHIGETIQKTEGISLAEKAARFFGLAQER